MRKILIATLDYVAIDASQYQQLRNRSTLAKYCRIALKK